LNPKNEEEANAPVQATRSTSTTTSSNQKCERKEPNEVGKMKLRGEQNALVEVVHASTELGRQTYRSERTRVDETAPATVM
jgi:hypothetical protein